MTTIESFRKFGLEARGFVGSILTAVGCALTLLGLAVFAVDQADGSFGLEGMALLVFLIVFIGAGLGLVLPACIYFSRPKGGWTACGKPTKTTAV